MKECKREAESEGKSPTRRTLTESERERERREEMREGMWGRDRERERDFLMEEGRERKESLEACGSKRAWWVRKDSRPTIGAAAVMVVAEVMRKMKRAATVVMGIFGGGAMA